MQIFHGNILTCDAKNTVAQILVEDKGRIVYVGNELPNEYNNAESQIELGEGAIVPSFVDTHIHFASFALFHAGLNVMDAESNAEIISMLREYEKHNQSKIIIGFGASPYSVSDGKLVSRTQLDMVSDKRPIVIIKYDGHACIVNTPLLNLIKKKIQHLRGYHEDTGEMNQEAFFAVSDFITNSVSLLDLVRNMQSAANYMASRGIGLIHTVSGVGFPMDMDVDLERWFARGVDNDWQMRVFMQTMSVKKVLKRKLPRIGGCFATALDGCYGSKDAAMRVPYELSDDRGVLYYTDEQVADFCKEANRANLQIEMHAIGDAAFDQATKALKCALDDYPRHDHRHTIIHACLPTDEGTRICRDYQICLAMQSAFIAWKQEPDVYLETILGKRVDQLNPLRTYWDNGIVLGAGSDAPCTDPNPIVWMHKACNHSSPAQSLTIQEALKMCTFNGAYISFDEKERGSLEVGKLADFVYLDKNPYAINKSGIKDIKVKQLYLKGKAYQENQQNPVGVILRGMMR